MLSLRLSKYSDSGFRYVWGICEGGVEAPFTLSSMQNQDTKSDFAFHMSKLFRHVRENGRSFRWFSLPNDTFGSKRFAESLLDNHCHGCMAKQLRCFAEPKSGPAKCFAGFRHHKTIIKALPPESFSGGRAFHFLVPGLIRPGNRRGLRCRRSLRPRLRALPVPGHARRPSGRGYSGRPSCSPRRCW